MSNSAPALRCDPRQDAIVRQLVQAVDLVLETRADGLQALVERAPVDHATFAYEAVVDMPRLLADARPNRCTSDGSVDVGRGLLRLGTGDSTGPCREVPLCVLRDALRECADSVCAALERRSFRTAEDLRLSLPRLDARSFGPGDDRREARGRLVYEHERGALSAEIWLEGGAGPTAAERR